MELSKILGPLKALGDVSLDDFLTTISQSQKQIATETETSGDNQLPPELVARTWVADNLFFEATRLLKQKGNASSELERLRLETANTKLKKSKQTKTNDEYGDEFNRTVCLIADSAGISLPEAEEKLKEEVVQQTSDDEIESYLFNNLLTQSTKRLKDLLSKNLKRLGDPDLALNFTSILFDIDLVKTEGVWGGNKFEQIVLKGLNGESLNLVTVLCLINDFDNQGGYTAVPNLNAYLDDPKLDPIPLIIDELGSVINFFNFYNINSQLSIYVADTDYTEIERYGPVNENNLLNINTYIKNLQGYVDGKNINIIPISEVTRTNPIYQKVKKDILEKVTTFKDPDFSREWYQKFESAFESTSESQSKKKFYQDKEMRKKALEITRRIWAVVAGQGAFLANQEPSTILVSTEKRERDTDYVIDKETSKKFIPVIYILRAADAWNRKLTSK